MRSGIVACEEGILSVERDGADGASDGIVVDLDAAVAKEQGQAVPVFCDVFEGLAEWGFGRDAGSIGGEPDFKFIDNRF